MCVYVHFRPFGRIGWEAAWSHASLRVYEDEVTCVIDSHDPPPPKKIVDATIHLDALTLAPKLTHQ